MLRSWDLLVYVLCVLCMGQRFAIGQTTSTSTTISTTEAGSVCTVDTADRAACNSATSSSDGSSSSDCADQGTWAFEVNATAGTIVTFIGRQPVLVLNTTADGVTTFQYNVGCCYDVTVNDATSNATTCVLDVNDNPTPAALSFDKDTFAHVAIGCGGGIVVMLCLVFALGAICNKDQKKQAAKYKENAGNQQRKVEQPRPPSLQDTPRRPALDAVFDTGQRHGPHAAGYSDRPMPDPRSASTGGPPNRGMPDPRSDPRLDPRSAPNVGHADRGMPDPREQSYGYDRPPYDEPRGRDYDDGYDNLSFQHDEYERPRPPREHHQREQMRRHTEAPPHGPPRYDNHGEAARNFNDPYDGYDRYDRREGNRHGRYSEMPQYDRGMRSGPPADFDMY